MKKVAIIGSGSWGAALGIYLANNGNEVRLWSFNEEEKRSINEDRKCVFLPKAVVPEGVICSTDFKEVLDGAEIILHVTPSKFVRNTIKQYKEYVQQQDVYPKLCRQQENKKSISRILGVIVLTAIILIFSILILR